MAGIFRYEAEYMEENETCSFKQEKGIMAAKSYKHAVKKLSKWFGGEKYLCSFKMTELYDILPDESIAEELGKDEVSEG